MPNYQARENSNNFGGLGPVEAGRIGGKRKGEKRKQREEARKRMMEDLNSNKTKEDMGKSGMQKKSLEED